MFRFFFKWLFDSFLFLSNFDDGVLVVESFFHKNASAGNC